MFCFEKRALVVVHIAYRTHYESENGSPLGFLVKIKCINLKVALNS